VKLKLKLNTRAIRTRLERLPKQSRVIIRQILNRQRRQSRTLMVRGLSRRLGVRPQKRLRRRILLPVTGQARTDHLVALGLSLVESMPARWFAKGRGRRTNLNLPGGTSLIVRRAVTGGAFRAQVKSHTGVFKRAARPAKRVSSNGGKTWLPIVEQQVSTARAGYRVREEVLEKLSGDFPREYNRRMLRVLRRVF